MASQPRKTVAVILDQSLIAEACDFSIDVSHAAEDGIAQAIEAEKERRWRIENAHAIRAEKEYIEKHGLPLANYWQF
ncbi:type II toxin-antitoxin system CcdA family antitoxin [Rhizobium terricola]|uniref:type II toxin-antitoxin system CcdA family antitoxin n=1 Tax=Rhizobium terricola TaxID=2728849 RepID=UPI0036F21F3D